MKRENKYKKKFKEPEVNEPAAEYIKPPGNQIIFFNSFEEMNEYDLQEMANSTPEERFKHITYMIQHLYADKLKDRVLDMKIYFD